MIAIEIVRRAYAVLQALYRRSRTRQQLLNLDSHLLSDIGLTQQQAMDEANKPFWRH